jgi:hypothetical protein
LASPETGSQNRRYRDLGWRQRPHAWYLDRGNARILWAILQRPGNAGSRRTAWWWIAATIEPVSTKISLLTGKRTGNFAESGLPMRFLSLIHERIHKNSLFTPKNSVPLRREFCRKLLALGAERSLAGAPPAIWGWWRPAGLHLLFRRCRTQAVNRPRAFSRGRSRVTCAAPAPSAVSGRSAGR